METAQAWEFQRSGFILTQALTSSMTCFPLCIRRLQSIPQRVLLLLSFLGNSIVM